MGEYAASLGRGLIEPQRTSGRYASTGRPPSPMAPLFAAAVEAPDHIEAVSACQTARDTATGCFRPAGRFKANATPLARSAAAVETPPGRQTRQHGPDLAQDRNRLIMIAK